MTTLPTRLDLSKLTALADDEARAPAPQDQGPAGQMRFRRSLSDLEHATRPITAPVSAWAQSRRQRRSLGDASMLKFRSGTQHAPTGSGANNPRRDQRHSEMVERFQIRRMGSSSTHSVRTSRNPSTARSTKVHPGLPEDNYVRFGKESGIHRHTTDTAGCSRTRSVSSLGQGMHLDAGYAEEGLDGVHVGGNSDYLSVRGLFSLLKLSVLTPFYPKARVAQARSIVLLLAFASHIIFFPVEVAFFNRETPRVFEKMDGAFHVVMLVDTLVNLNTAFFDARGRLVTNRFSIARHYAQGWLIPDLMAMVPLEWVHSKFSRPSIHALVDAVLRIPRFFHVTEIWREAWWSRLYESDYNVFASLVYSRLSHVVRIVSGVFLIVLGTHFTACILQIIAVDEIAPAATTPFTGYVAKMYDAVQLLQGQGVTTQSIGETIFASVCILVGSIILAIIFGNVAILVSNFNANSTNYQRKMESVFAIMSKLRLPAPLRERIHQYYEHLWREYESLDGEIVAFSKGLSHTLELEVVLFKYMDLIMHVPFWRDGSPDFQKQLMLSLRVRVYLPDDYIIRRGEVGDEFFMINHGICELVLGPDSMEQSTDPMDESYGELADVEDSYHLEGKNVNVVSLDRTDVYGKLRAPLTSRRDGSAGVAASETTQVLRRGQAFGELALLMNYERSANVRALTYVEMCVLKREDIQRVFVKHPTDRAEVVRNMLSRSMEICAARKVFCPLRQAVVAVFENASEDDPTQGPTPMPSISPAHAAILITAAINVEDADSSLKYGIGPSLKHKLRDLRASDAEVEDGAQIHQVARSNFARCASHLDIPFRVQTGVGQIVKRLDRLQDSQRELLSALQALNLDLQATRSLFVETQQGHSE